uniref:Ripply transcriptional repressor 1 n=1 Tax=Dromaius novaehollandiae TaxID=8790 RepID=A0A8C4JBC4_DRONO
HAGRGCAQLCSPRPGQALARWTDCPGAQHQTCLLSPCPCAGGAAGLPGGSRRSADTLGAGGRLSPRRLLWPRSKSFDYLYSVGERLLHSFPVQATLCLYDDSDSEEEEDEEEEEEEAVPPREPGSPRRAPGAARAV